MIHPNPSRDQNRGVIRTTKSLDHIHIIKAELKLSYFFQLEEFRSPIYAMQTCFTMLLNKFKFGGLKQESHIAAVFFVVFAIACTWILINVLLTIILEAFEMVSWP